MASDDRRKDDESDPAPKRNRYLRTAVLVVQFVRNLVKLATTLAS